MQFSPVFCYFFFLKLHVDGYIYFIANEWKEAKSYSNFLVSVHWQPLNYCSVVFVYQCLPILLCGLLLKWLGIMRNFWTLLCDTGQTSQMWQMFSMLDSHTLWLALGDSGSLFVYICALLQGVHNVDISTHTHTHKTVFILHSFAHA